MNAFTSSRFSFINMSNKQDFVVEPFKLLETTALHVIDVNDVYESLTEIAENFFVRPERGAYQLTDHLPFILANEVLYTHPETYEFFPEIGEQIVSQKGRKLGIVGRRISWIEAFENPINVYNEKGRLLLKPNSDRKNFFFGSSSQVYKTKFLVDYIKFIVLTETKWGDTEKIVEDIKSYLINVRDFDYLFTHVNKIFFELTNVVREIVRKNPWLIYFVSNVRNQLIIETSCDWRHYNCNLTLWEKIHPEQMCNEDPLFAYSYDPKGPEISINKIDKLFEIIFEKTSIKLEDIKEFFKLLDETKNNKQLTGVVLNCLKEFDKLNNKDNLSSNLVSNLIRGQDAFHSSDFNQRPGIFIL